MAPPIKKQKAAKHNHKNNHKYNGKLGILNDVVRLFHDRRNGNDRNQIPSPPHVLHWDIGTDLLTSYTFKD